MSLKPRIINFKNVWDSLKETVKEVVTLGNVPRTVWNDRFSDVYSLCVAYPEPFADRLYMETKLFLEGHVKRLLEEVRNDGEANLLKSYSKAWSQYSLGISYLHRLYLYLNQQHIKKQKLTEAEIIYGNLAPDAQEQMEIGELGLYIWERRMIEHLKENLVNLLLEGIHLDRQGEGTPSSVIIIRDVIQSFVDVEKYNCKAGNLVLYEQVFEAPFLQATGEYYKREASRLLQECDVSMYIEKVTQKLSEETYRCQKFLHFSSYSKVKAKCEQHMVADHLQFLHGECTLIVQQERKVDLRLMYPLLRSVPTGIPVLIENMLEHMKHQGLQTVGNLKGDNVHIQFVEGMLDVHKKYKELINEVFIGDQAFMGALDKACNKVINHRPSQKLSSRSSELLAKYCDSLLKKSTKGISDSEIDEKLTQSIIIFKYIDDKDVFQKFYSRMLAKRLIHQQSHAMDAEEAMINRLKQACGYEFTNKLHRMFTDISLSADLNNKFNAVLKTDNVDLGISFSICVLQIFTAAPEQSRVAEYFWIKQGRKDLELLSAGGGGYTQRWKKS